MKVAIIGGGISGLSIAKMLHEKHEVVVFEADSRPGGLIKCDVVEGSLFHRTGGHVFNSKRKDVFDWFWGQFDKEKEFTKAMRNAAVFITNKMIPYPIENHAYLLNERIQQSFIRDLVDMARSKVQDIVNFEEFLLHRFGKTLYELYFKPYNYKVWRRDLTQIPLAWLEGKLPMPSLEELIYNNFNHAEEQSFVHSSFYYAKKGGSQFIIERLAQGLNVQYDAPVNRVEKLGDQWMVNNYLVDIIIFSGNIKQLPSLFSHHDSINIPEKSIADLESHGTTSVFCEIDKNPYSWIYLPGMEQESHRIICTGNFAHSNNAEGKMTGTIEFTDYISKEDILSNLAKVPFSPKYLTHNYEKYTYPIQNADTRDMIGDLKDELRQQRVYLLGRFAEWEYYNMDVAIGAAIDLSKKLCID